MRAKHRFQSLPQSVPLGESGRKRPALRGQPEVCLPTAGTPPRARDMGQDELSALLSSWEPSWGQPRGLATLRWPRALLPSGVPVLAAGVCLLGVLRGKGLGRRGEKPHIPGESGPGWCQGGVWTLSGLSGTDPIPGSCFISPLSICALRVLGGDSECFRFLAGCTGRLRRPAGARKG